MGPDTRWDDVSDADLLRRHAGGDEDAFGELVRRHRDRLWAVAMRTLGNPDDAADAVQDALVSAFRAARTDGAYRGQAAVTTWLHRIVVNACLDRVRRARARPTVPLPPDIGALAAPGDALADHDTALVVAEALGTLPAEQRAAIVLVDLQGFSVDDAAAVLDVAPGTVKSRCSRGRARLLPLLASLRNRTPGSDVTSGQRRTPPLSAPPQRTPPAAPAPAGTDVPPRAEEAPA
jgi:RNA polymerase sigma-70 factor (ECF subfamily)